MRPRWTPSRQRPASPPAWRTLQDRHTGTSAIGSPGSPGSLNFLMPSRLCRLLCRTAFLHPLAFCLDRPAGDSSNYTGAVQQPSWCQMRHLYALLKAFVATFHTLPLSSTHPQSNCFAPDIIARTRCAQNGSSVHRMRAGLDWTRLRTLFPFQEPLPLSALGSHQATFFYFNRL